MAPPTRYRHVRHVAQRHNHGIDAAHLPRVTGMVHAPLRRFGVGRVQARAQTGDASPPRAIGADVARLQLLTIEKIEVLRDLIQEGMSLADLLERKDTESYRNMGFKNFLFDIVRDRLRVRGAARQQAVDRMKQRVLRLLAGTSSGAKT